MLDGFTYALTPGGNITRTDPAADGSGMTQVLHTTAAPVTTTQRIDFTCDGYADFSIDDIRALAGDGLTTTYVHAHNMADELTSVTANGGTTNFSYDYWGRMVSKSLGSHTTSYAWHYGGKLTRVASTFPGEGTVTYGYGGDQKRRERNDGTITKYNWDRGWSMINEENSAGTLTRTYVGRWAEVSGADPATGTYRYYGLDHLGSTRSLWSADKAALGSYEYTPYGESYAESGASPLHRFTGHHFDGSTRLHYAPYRYYSSDSGRWLSRDPLGIAAGLNTFAYVRANPIIRHDPLGLEDRPPPANGAVCNESDSAIAVLANGEYCKLGAGECTAKSEPAPDGGVWWLDADGFWCGGKFYMPPWRGMGTGVCRKDGTAKGTASKPKGRGCKTDNKPPADVSKLPKCSDRNNYMPVPDAPQ